jgi:signal transduction histidine kinase
VAKEPTQLLRVSKSDFNDMLSVSTELGQRLIGEMSNRVRGDVRMEQQREKMMALGRLSAGLAHELNNPTAAIRRTSENLAERFVGQSSLILNMVRSQPDSNAIDAMQQLRNTVIDRNPPVFTSPLYRSDREESLADWLEEKGIAEAWDLASVFTDTGVQIDDLDQFSETVSDGILCDALTWVAGSIEIHRMIKEVSSAAERVSELVSSVKVYSHMDRSTEHKPTDVREGLDNTLTIFGHRLKEKSIRLTREYPDDLPTIPGNAGELNQVWTNLIDNALDAMDDGGELTIEVEQDDWGVAVKIVDDGGGIPDNVRHRIFDPFFTTKDVGEGTGLGLDIARRIVNTHGGQIEARIRPGKTEMFVRLPIKSVNNLGSTHTKSEEDVTQ